jgi:hypothetical protein
LFCAVLFILNSLASAVTVPSAPRLLPPTLQNSTNVLIRWEPVTADILGRAILITNYSVYRVTDALAAPDFAAHSNRIGTVGTTSLTHIGAATNVGPLLYYVVAMDSNGLGSIGLTNVALFQNQFLLAAPGTNLFAWVALPSMTGATNVASWAQAAGITGLIYRHIGSNQSYEVWDSLVSTGVNFPIQPGEAYGVEASSSMPHRVSGVDGAPVAYSWSFNTNALNHRWIGLPVNSVYTNASSLANAIPSVTRVSTYASSDGQFLNWFKLGDQWLGTNFPVAAGRGVLVSIESDSAWTSRLVYPAASVVLATNAGFVGLHALTASGVAVAGASAISEYAWDETGDGTYEIVAASPPMPITKNFTNPEAVYPTFRVRDQRGFYAIGAARYEAISMGLYFDEPAFQPAAGAANLLAYAASTGGVFSSWIEDANGNIVRMLESNVVHGAGYLRESLDHAGHAIYDAATNFNGLNGGNGFLPWKQEPTSNASTSGWIVKSSTGNASPFSLGIDRGDRRSWSAYANSGQVANGYRGFAAPLAVGETFSLEMDNGWISSGATVGFGLQNAASQNLVEVYYRGFDANNSYKINDVAGERNVGVPWTANGVRVLLTLTASNQFSVTLKSAEGTNATLVGSLKSASGGQAISQLRLFNAFAGSGPEHDSFWNDLKIIGAPTAWVSWDGRNEAGQLVSNGVFYLVVEQSVNGTTVRYDPKPLQFGSNLTAQITGVSVPDAFDPSGSVAFPIQFHLPAPAYVTIHILDELAQPIAVVCTNAPRAAGFNLEQWDGRLADGSLIPQGRAFSAAIQAVGAGGNGMVLLPGSATVDNLRGSAAKFTPSLNPYGNNTNSLALSYALSAPSDVRVTVRGADGSAIHSFLDPAKMRGPNQTIWSGVTSNGLLAAPGTYSLSIVSEANGVFGDARTIWAEVYY